MKTIPSTVWALGIVSLLTDVSSEMIHSLLPLFLVSVLGAGALTVGWIEGSAEAVALIVKTFSGTLSDRFGRRKRWVLAGYGLATLTKPLFALANSIPLVFGARFLDRIGKGIRGAPRDALIADATPAAVRGAAFGLRQSLDTIGAFVGPLLAIVLMRLTGDHYRRVFAFAVIPGVLALIILFYGVREPDQKMRPTARPAIRWHVWQQLGRTYWMVVALGSVFTLARFSEAFLLLRAQSTGMTPDMVPIHPGDHECGLFRNRLPRGPHLRSRGPHGLAGRGHGFSFRFGYSVGAFAKCVAGCFGCGPVGHAHGVDAGVVCRSGG